MKRAYKRMISAIVMQISLFLVPGIAFAQSRKLDVSFGTTKSIWQVLGSIVQFLAASIGAVSVMLFVVGAFMITVSGAKEDARQNGKNLIIGSLLSLAVVTGAYAILRTVDFFLT